jgi:tRNA1(Val) A37 N6-methylase TrmN6
MKSAMPAADASVDTILGGRLMIGQPAKGHRAGTDAVLVAAAVPARPGESIADFGAGVGTAGLAVIVRVPRVRALLIEIDAYTAGLAEANVLANDLSGCAKVLAMDVGEVGMGATSALASSTDHIVCNPPFNNPAGGRISPDADTARARVAKEGQLEDWMRAAARMLKPGGSVTLIHRPEGVQEILAALSRRYGGVTLRFVHPDPASPAVRVLVQARKDTRAHLRVLPPLILNKAGGGFTPEAEGLHRDLAALDMS